MLEQKPPFLLSVDVSSQDHEPVRGLAVAVCTVQAKQGQLGPIQTNEELTSWKRENVDMGSISSILKIYRFCNLHNLCLISGAPFRIQYNLENQE